MPTLKRSQHVVHRLFEGKDSVFFRSDPSGDGVTVKDSKRFSIPVREYRDMGSPRTLTVTIEPGDLINDCVSDAP